MQVARVSLVVLCMFASMSKNRLVWHGALDQTALARIRFHGMLSAATAGLLAISGLSMVFWLAKPRDYYLENPVFWAEMALFVMASGLIVWTKVDFRHAGRWQLRLGAIGPRSGHPGV
jgi:uncharacterized membrane protein